MLKEYPLDRVFTLIEPGRGRLPWRNRRQSMKPGKTSFITAVSVSFANGLKRLENVSPSLFSGDREGRVLLV